MKHIITVILALFLPVFGEAQNSCLSLGMNSSAANGGSGSPSIASSSVIAFSSQATNITSSPIQTGGLSDVYVYNSSDSTFQIVSRLPGDPTIGSGETPSISRSGRVVAFRSYSETLVSGDTNQISDIFVRDLDSSEIKRVSVSSTGQQANGAPSKPLISGNGRYVFFGSLASNLVDGDTNSSEDIFRHDRITGQTIRVNLLPGNAQSSAVSVNLSGVSSDGRWMAFEESVNSNLSVYFRDIEQGVTTLVAQSGADASMSADGSSIAYWDGDREIFYHYDRATGVSKATCSSRDPSAAPIPDGIIGYSPFSSLSDDGRYLAYAGITASEINGIRVKVADLFICDTQTKTMYRPIVAANGGRANGTPASAQLSGDGTLVAYTSDATNLVTTPSNTGFQVYTTVIDLCVDDSLKALPGVCGCGFSDSDANSNGAADCLDPSRTLKPSKPKISGRGKNTEISMQAFTGTGITYLVSFKSVDEGSLILKRTFRASTGKIKNIPMGQYKISYIIRMGSIKSKSSAAISRVVDLSRK